MELFRVKNDVNGNPRVVIHFFDFLSAKEHDKYSLDECYNLAHKRAKKIGGRKYMGKDFGGGFVFQCYNERMLIERINEQKDK